MINYRFRLKFALYLSSVVFAFSVYAGGEKTAALPQGYMGKHHSVEAKFEDIKEDIESAITNRGNVINNISHIGNMLARTAGDVGAKDQVYLKAEALEFCSATLSRRMLAIDPHNIIYCPYVIAIYVLPDNPKKVHVAFRAFDRVGSPSSKEVLAEAEAYLTEIVKEGIDGF